MMPVEVKELIIRAVAVNDQSAGDDVPRSPAADDDREALVEDCVRRVLQILKTAKER